jgi:hypothetical protein
MTLENIASIVLDLKKKRLYCCYDGTLWMGKYDLMFPVMYYLNKYRITTYPVLNNLLLLTIIGEQDGK